MKTSYDELFSPEHFAVACRELGLDQHDAKLRALWNRAIDKAADCAGFLEGVDLDIPKLKVK